MIAKDSVLHVLMYIFNNYLQKGSEVDLCSKALMADLQEEGFSSEAIQNALEWLESLSEINEICTEVNAPSGVRVFTAEERFFFDVKCQALLLTLRQQHILSSNIFELVVHFVLQLESEGIDVSLIKWVTLMVLYNMPEQEEALKKMQLLVLGDDSRAGRPQ